MSVKRKCVCCDKEYDYCPNCAQKDQPAWMVTFCCEGCKDLFNIVSAYNAKRIGKAAVQSYVAEHDVNNTKFTGPVKKVLDEVGVKIELKKDVSDATSESRSIWENPKKDNDNTHRSRSRSIKRRHRQFGY